MPLLKDMQRWTDEKKSTSPDGQGTYKPIAPVEEVNQGSSDLFHQSGLVTASIFGE